MYHIVLLESSIIIPLFHHHSGCTRKHLDLNISSRKELAIESHEGRHTLLVGL